MGTTNNKKTTMVLINRLLRPSRRPGHLPWVKYHDAASGKPFWHNKDTEKTTWDNPAWNEGAMRRGNNNVAKDMQAPSQQGMQAAIRDGAVAMPNQCQSAALPPSPIAQTPSTLSEAPSTRHIATGMPGTGHCVLSMSTPGTAPWMSEAICCP